MSTPSSLDWSRVSMWNLHFSTPCLKPIELAMEEKSQKNERSDKN